MCNESRSRMIYGWWILQQRLRLISTVGSFRINYYDWNLFIMLGSLVDSRPSMIIIGMFGCLALSVGKHGFHSETNLNTIRIARINWRRPTISILLFVHPRSGNSVPCSLKSAFEIGLSGNFPNARLETLPYDTLINR